MADVIDELFTHRFGAVTGCAPAVSRLPASTRALAARYLSGEIGRTTCVRAATTITTVGITEFPTPNAQAAEAIRRIAQSAPLRILPEEHLVGAATLEEASWHQIPLTQFSSVSHTTLGFEKALRVGLRGLRAEVDARLAADNLDAEARDLLQAMYACLDALQIWHRRYVEALETLMAESEGETQAHYRLLLETLRSIPEYPPTNFREALQALWLLWDFTRLCGNWSAIGRIDKLLGPWLEADLQAGRLTRDEARNLLAHFWIKGCEWITAEGRGSGDAQFYQNIVLAGVDETGRDVTNAVTYLVLDVVEELHISDFPIAVRISAQTPEMLLRRVAEVQRLGGGIIAVYNETRIIDSLVRFGYPPEEARNFANDGCWEILIPGKTKFDYQPFDLVLLLQQTLGLGVEGQAVDFPSFEALYQDFAGRLRGQVEQLLSQSSRHDIPAPLPSLFTEDCIARGRAYAHGGPRYTVLSPHAGGLPDVADSLLVIKTLVYDEGHCTLPAFVDILRRDWQTQPDLRRQIRARFAFFGNDDASADAMVIRVFNDYTELVGRTRERDGILRPAGISTFGRQLSDFRPHRLATPSGRMKGDILANNFSPSPGSDLQGPTAVIRSHCAVDFSRLPCGTALEVSIMPDAVKGEEGLNALMVLMRTFVALGGIFLQLDVVDAELLRAAQQHPERYPNLSVRVSGWSARFATLDSAWQEMIIQRAERGGY